MDCEVFCSVGQSVSMSSSSWAWCCKAEAPVPCQQQDQWRVTLSMGCWGTVQYLEVCSLTEYGVAGDVLAKRRSEGNGITVNSDLVNDYSWIHGVWGVTNCDWEEQLRKMKVVLLQRWCLCVVNWKWDWETEFERRRMKKREDGEEQDGDDFKYWTKTCRSFCW